MMAAVLEAINAHVGRLLRSKNAFREDAEVSYGYRAFLGNLQLESGPVSYTHLTLPTICSV